MAVERGRRTIGSDDQGGTTTVAVGDELLERAARLMTEKPGSSRPRVGVIGSSVNLGSIELVRGLRRIGCAAALVDPLAPRAVLGDGDIAIARLDLLPTLDGVEPGLDTLAELELRGVRLLNRPEALLRAHDKLLTAGILRRARIPHPATVHLLDPYAPLGLKPPLVVKPRFGSWGVDVYRCQTSGEARLRLHELRDRPWFRAHGVLVQALVRAEPRDVRLVVAGGVVVGAIERIAAPGEWRTNVSTGASRSPTLPTRSERELAVAAAEAVGLDLVGVDVLHGEEGDVVIELNGAVDFDVRYSLDGRDIYADICAALLLVPVLSVAR